MQDTLHSFPPPGRLRPLPHVVDNGRFRPSREHALDGAHASLQAAEENLRSLAAAIEGRRPGRRAALFNRPR
jgi:hypothetical protein